MRILYSLERNNLSYFTAALLFISTSLGAKNSCKSNDLCHDYALSTSNFVAVSAPPDITLTINSIGKCDTLFLMPPATLTGICPPLSSIETRNTFTTLNTNGGNLFFTTGIFNVIYTVVDACGTFRDTTKVTVFDATPPKVICIPDHVASLNSLGEAIIDASAFDGGSTDDCNHVYFKAKRMNVPPSYSCTTSSNPLYRFDDVVRFCCNDIDSVSIPVILRVYDVFPGNGPVVDSLYRGHYGECMVMISVVDKLAPSVFCPPNITVKCGADLDSVLRLARPIIFDNCTMSSIDSTITYKLNSCGVGTVERKYTGTDRRGQSASCTQIITVLKNNSFNGLDTNYLKWPESKTIFACRVMADPSLTGTPRLRDNECDLVAINYKDEVYSFSQSGVCAKILRKWEAINWCVYNRNLPNPNVPTNGYYTFTQELKIMDTIAPIITGVTDQRIGISTSNCSPAYINLQSAQATDCNSTTALIYSYTVDLNSDGTIDIRGNGNNPSGIYPIGIHDLCYIVEDSCSNLARTCVDLIVFDAKAPNVSVMSGLSTSLTQMANGIMVMVNAKLFNISSSDNCTPAKDLRYSFSNNINDSIRVYNCDSIGRRNVNIYVWDQAGNYTVVQSYIVVGDELGICPPTFGNITVSGLIKDVDGEKLSDIDVLLSSANSKSIQKTNYNGLFAFQTLEKNKSYSLSASYSENYLDHITTADILKIQKYILGIQDLDNPYDLLAADVDMNGSVSARDISILRSLILGNTLEFSHKNSYIFIDDKYQFVNQKQPFQEYAKNAICNMAGSTQNQSINFIGIKLGNVQHKKAQGLHLESEKINLHYRTTNEGIEIFSSQDINCAGFQLGFMFKGLCFIKNGIKSEILSEKEIEESIFLQNNSIKICYANPKNIFIPKNKVILTIPIQYNDPNCTEFSLNNNFNNLLISPNSQEIQVNLTEYKTPVNLGFTIVGIQSDPFYGNMNIRLQLFHDQTINITSISNDGRVIFNKSKSMETGIQDIRLIREEFPIPGIYFLNIESKYNNEIIKLNTL